MKMTCANTSALFKALSEDVRLRILALLAHARGELCVCDIMSALALPQSTTSRHLAHLRGAGLVQASRRRNWTYYRLAEDFGVWLEELLLALGDSCPQIRQDWAVLEERLANKGSACTSNR
jgi:ArsR family transcriptional regulator, arsenate/arsenite/antimonite-responsive transcriptional repressor